MPYLLIEMDLAEPQQGVVVPEGHCGFAIVLRVKGAPVGFLMHGAAAGTSFSPEQISDLIRRKAELQPREDSEYGVSFVPLPSLTVAVCTRNRTAVLERCLQHLTNLRETSGEQFKILVVDNAPSDDRTRNLVSNLASICYVCEPKPGLDFARNRALRECETTLLAYIDDDAVVDRFWICGIRRALAENPDAGAITGPVLPWELATEPQILLEERGGFGRYFRKQRITNSDQPYPYDFGSGCNMVFLRKALIAISGFDEALDNGRILAGDQDAFHRMVLAGYPLVADPGVLVFHEHRRDYTALRCQMRLWGASTMAMMMKNLLERFGKQSEVLGYIYRRLRYLVHQFVRPAKNRHPAFWPRDLVSAELLGAFAGILGAYGRSRRHADRIRASFSEGTHAQ